MGWLLDPQVNVLQDSCAWLVYTCIAVCQQSPDVWDVEQHHCQALQAQAKRPCLVACSDSTGYSTAVAAVGFREI
jgi:hypothetical protein